MENGTSTTAQEDRRREEGTFLAATVFGTPVRVHGIFSILILVFGGIGAAGGGAEIALLIPAVLLINAFHELGHALLAKRLGYAVRSVVLHPFRGHASFSRPQNPRHELFIALAGPAANLCAATLVLERSLYSPGSRQGEQAAAPSSACCRTASSVGLSS